MLSYLIFSAVSLGSGELFPVIVVIIPISERRNRCGERGCVPSHRLASGTIVIQVRVCQFHGTHEASKFLSQTHTPPPRGSSPSHFTRTQKQPGPGGHPVQPAASPVPWGLRAGIWSSSGHGPGEGDGSKVRGVKVSCCWFFLGKDF